MIDASRTVTLVSAGAFKEHRLIVGPTVRSQSVRLRSLPRRASARLATRRAVSRLQHQKQIWLAATPKSASTFLTSLLQELWRGHVVTGASVPAHGTRPQVPDPRDVRALLVGRRPFFSGHLHMQRTAYFTNAFGLHAGGGVIVQSRDILDTVVSLKDHIDRAPQQPWVLLPSGETGASWTRLEDDEKYWAIALYYAPWHCQFVTSWENEVGRFEVTYERLTTEPAKVLQEICERFEMP